MLANKNYPGTQSLTDVLTAQGQRATSSRTVRAVSSSLKVSHHRIF